MTDLVPDMFEPAPDAEPASWIVEGVKPWGTDRVCLWSFMPDVFEAYARVLHPPSRTSEDDRARVRWSDLAARNGVVLGPETPFRAVSGFDPNEHDAWDRTSPVEGTIEPEQVAALAELLAPCTGTRDVCWIASWVGWGSWRPGVSSTMLSASEPGRRGRRAIKQELKAVDAWLATIPVFGIQARDYYLFRGRTSDVAAFAIGGWQQSPSIWWPDDRAWCVVIEVDGYSTYVGGSVHCIDALLASGSVEALRVTADVRMDPGPH